MNKYKAMLQSVVVLVLLTPGASLPSGKVHQLVASTSK